MRKVLLLLFGMIVSQLYGQSEKYRPGFYTDLSGNKISGFINYISGGLIKFRSNNEEKPKKLKPDEVMGFTCDGKEYIVFRNFKVKLQLMVENREFRFVRQVKKGKVNLYTDDESIHSRGVTTDVVVYLLKRENSDTIDYVPFMNGAFRKTMSVYFTDNQEIREKILNKELTYDDIERIVDMFNK
jgi:hypothetical protein